MSNVDWRNVVLPRFRLELSRLAGANLLAAGVWDAFDEWMDDMPLAAGDGYTLGISFDARLEALTWRASGPADEFAPALAEWFDRVGAPDDARGLLRDSSDRLDLHQLGAWIAGRAGAVDGGWSATDVPLADAVGIGSLAAAAVGSLREWAAGAGVERVAVERSVAGDRPATTFVVALDGDPVDALSSATTLIASLRVPGPPDSALGALAQGTGVVVSTALSPTGVTALDVGARGLPVGVVIDLWREAGGDHETLAMLQGAIGADDPTVVSWSTTSGGPRVTAHYLDLAHPVEG